MSPDVGSDKGRGIARGGWFPVPEGRRRKLAVSMQLKTPSEPQRHDEHRENEGWHLLRELTH